MGAFAILSLIPWDTILKYSPIILEAGGRILKRVNTYIGGTANEGGRRDRISLEQLDKRVRLLEQNEVEQADLIDKMATQMNELSIAANIISKRTLLALSLSSLSLVISLVLLVIRVAR